MTNAAFNRGIKYNRSPFGTRYVTAALIFADMIGVSGLTTNITGAFVLDSSLDGIGDITARLSRDDKLNALIEGSSDITAMILHVRFERSQLEGIGGLNAGNEVFTIMRFLDNIAAGKVVVIDSSVNIVTLDGEFGLENFTGQLLSLEQGSYRIEYSDGEESRTLQVDIEYTNKFK